MALLGPLLKARRNRDGESAWNRPNLNGPASITVTSTAFVEGGQIPRVHAGKRAGGSNLSPSLAWSHLPDGTSEVLLVVEDVDVPTSKPFVHCLALLDPTLLVDPNGPPEGSLSNGQPAAGVTLLRSTVARGYFGPEPLKGHGPHRYSFQLFALTGAPLVSVVGTDLLEMKAGDVLDAVTSTVLARGRVSGTYER